MTKQKPKFRRSDGHKYSKLGVRRKKLQKYRKAKGGDNKIRLNMKGHVRSVRVGFRSAVKERDLIKGMKPVMIYNVNDLKKIEEGMIGIVGKIGAKKKIEIAKVASEKKIKLLNLDAEKFLKKIEDKMKKTREEKKIRGEKKRARDKKAKEKEKEVDKKDKLEEKVGDEKSNFKQDKGSGVSDGGSSSLDKKDSKDKIEEDLE